MVITLRNLSRRQLQAFMWSCTPFERIDSSVIKEFVAGDTASLSLCIHFNAACWWPECELPVDCCSVPSPPLSVYVVQVRGHILAPSSCATLTDRSPWSFFASHVTFCAVAAVTCPPTKTTGQSSDIQHKDTAEKG